MSDINAHTESELSAVSLITAPLSNEMQDRLHALQTIYSEQLGATHLLLPGEDDLYTTFAEVVVPQSDENSHKIRNQTKRAKGRLAIAAEQAIQIIGEPFEVPVTYDNIEAKDGKVVVSASETGQVTMLRRFFTAVLWSSLDRTPDEVSVVPVIFKNESDTVFTEKNVKPHFRPIHSPIKSLQVRKFSTRTKKMERVDEFS
jgi:hypothetical protein